MGYVLYKVDSSTGEIGQDTGSGTGSGRLMAMAASSSKLRFGYEDERFEDIVSENFHCIICTNVFKDPVMCRQNEHIFCRVCITKHLARSQTCPSCIEPLTVDTLLTPPRIILSCLEEFKIRCDFYERGCRQIVQLGKLERHVKECGFMPAVCPNEGCHVEVNARDLLHHKTAVCEKRRVQCHKCAELKQEMQVVKKELTKKLVGIEAKQDKFVADVNDKLGKLELNTQQLEADNRVIKQNLSVVIEQLGRIVKGTSYEASASQSEMQKSPTASKMNVCGFPSEMHKSSTASKVVKAHCNIVVAGGSRTVEGKHECLNSVEVFDLTKRSWTMLQPMNECRKSASSVVYNNQIIVSGGFSKAGTSRSMEALPNADQLTRSVTWKEFPAILPNGAHGHSTVVYNDHLITVGGLIASYMNDYDNGDVSKRIYDVSLIPPYSLQELDLMRHKRMSLAMHLFNDKLVIVGGENYYTALDSVLLYDLVRNKSKELAPLPYPVGEMATVLWRENILIFGGASFSDVFRGRTLQILDSVLIYNIITQKVRKLKKMKYKRRGATAVLIGNNVYVMGGVDENEKELKSVECFDIERNSWQEFPPMIKARYQATAVAC